MNTRPKRSIAVATVTILFAFSFFAGGSSANGRGLGAGASPAPSRLLASSRLASALAPSGQGLTHAHGSDAMNSQPASQLATQASAQVQKANVLSFELNKGQFLRGVLFLARGPGYGVSLMQTKTIVTVKSHPVTFGFIGSVNGKAHVTGQQQLPAKINYYMGSHASTWRFGVPTFARVLYSGLYPGIDLVWYVSQNHLEYDWQLRPHAKPAGIGLAVSGAKSLALDKSGRLIIGTSVGQLTESAPLAHQQIHGLTHTVKAWWSLSKGNRAMLKLGKYNHNAAVVIDPTVSYSTYVGAGDGSAGTDLASDGNGNVYISGFCWGIVMAGDPNHSPASTDTFVTKINAATGAILYTTYLGGDGLHDALGRGIAVDPSGNVYVGGYTTAPDLPNSTDGYNDGGNWLGDAFIAKLDPATGYVAYTTYIGGNNGARAWSVATDGSGGAYLAGWTPSSDLPATTNPYPGPNNGPLGPGSAFVTKVAAGTGGILWSTYVGGNVASNPCCGAGDSANAVAVDPAGDVYLAGSTASSDLQNATNTYVPSTCVGEYSNTYNAFLAKIAGTSGAISFTTYVGGSCWVSGDALTISGNSAYVAGRTDSPDLPYATNALASDTNAVPFGPIDGYLSMIDISTGNLTHSTYLGGKYLRHNDQSWADPRRSFDPCYTGVAGVTVNAGSAYVVGNTNCPDMSPSTYSFADTQDAYVAQVEPATGIISCTTFVGSGSDAEGVATNGSGDIYVEGSTGLTGSLPNPTNFATGASQAFFAALSPGGSCALQQPILTWASPDPITTSTPLGGAQLDATANVPGTFTYLPAAGTVLSQGSGQILLATFTPEDSSHYTPETITTTIDVN